MAFRRKKGTFRRAKKGTFRRKKMRKFNKLTKQLRPPTKFSTEVVAAAAVSNAVSNWQVNDSIAQGTTSSTRLGEKILIKGIRMVFNMNGADATNIVRLVVLSPRNISIGMPVGLTVDDMIDFRFYKVHMDRRYKLVNVAGADDLQKIGKFYLKRNHVINYSGTGVADQRTGLTYWLLAVSDSPAAAHPTLSWRITTLFQDCV